MCELGVLQLFRAVNTASGKVLMVVICTVHYFVYRHGTSTVGKQITAGVGCRRRQSTETLSQYVQPRKWNLREETDEEFCLAAPH